jgi:hypothetical protein
MSFKEATMIDAEYFDEEPADAAGVDSAVQDMARRQFGISLAVGLMFLAVAGLIAVRAPREETIAVQAAPHRMVGVQAPQMVKQPMLATEQGVVK